MYSATVVVFALITGVVIGIMVSIVIDALSLKKYGRWQQAKLWVVTDSQGNIIRAQFEHPLQAVEDAKQILNASRGDKRV